MAARLVFLTGSKAGSAKDLKDDDLTIGRSPDRSISFGSEEVLVSAHHASILHQHGCYVLKDEGSRNGTFVNGDRITEHVLEDQDLIQFGAGGPGARYLADVDPAATPTLDQHEMAEAIEILKRTKLTGEAEPAVEPAVSPLTTTRELVVMAVRRGKRTRRWLLAVAAITAAGLGAIIVSQQLSRSNLQQTLAQLSLSLASERASRSALEQTLAQVQTQADSLRAALEGEQLRRDPAAIQRLSQGVALIVFTYGYKESGGDRFLRYAVDGQGNFMMTAGPDGSPTPNIRLGGPGPAIRRQGTATGFLIDTTGFLVTNRHVARPWEEDEQLALMTGRGLSLMGQFIEMRAYFPPGNPSWPLVVEELSDDADVAVLRVLGSEFDRPALPLAPAATPTRPGDELVLIGYPTGVHNLLFRVNREERGNIWNVAGQDAQKMAEELAQRQLIQPLITDGRISDTTTTEVIHTAATTVGGSGGPLIDGSQRVVAVHYASVRSPAPGDPFQTQRGVPVRFVWDILPEAIRRAVRR
jgi:S1-C subfamily serine protease